MTSVLVIDDEEPERAVVRSALNSADYEVVEASNGREALARFRQCSPDLVIADIHARVQWPRCHHGADWEFLDVKVITISGVPGC